MTIGTQLVQTHPRHTPTNLEVNLDGGFGDEVENVNYHYNPH